MKLKSYLVFTSFWYRLIVYLLIPVALTGLGLLIERGIKGAGLIIVTMFLPTAEIMSDGWLFGGIQTKDSMRLDYLKVSGRGRKVLKNALWMDLARKLLTTFGTLSLYCVAAMLGYRETMGEGMYRCGALLYLALLSYFVSALGTFLSRYGGLLWINFLISYGGVFLTMLGIFLLGLQRYLFLVNVVFLLLGILISVLAVRTAMKKVERSYYDQ